MESDSSKIKHRITGLQKLKIATLGSDLPTSYYFGLRMMSGLMVNCSRKTDHENALKNDILNIISLITV